MNEQAHLRVLVALDCEHPSSAALQRLPQLAGTESLELIGLYIEDEDLMRAARLPGLREISLAGQEVELTLARLEQEIARDLARIRHAFEDATRQLRLRARFEIARGHVAEALCAAASRSDFVLVSRPLRASGLRPRAAPQFGALAHQARRILFVNEPWASGTSVIVLGHDPAAVAAGLRLAETESLDLVVALPQGGATPLALPRQAVLVRVAQWSEDAIADLCVRRDARLLIVPPDTGLDTGALLTGLLDRLPCSLLKLG